LSLESLAVNHLKHHLNKQGLVAVPLGRLRGGPGDPNTKKRKKRIIITVNFLNNHYCKLSKLPTRRLPTYIFTITGKCQLVRLG